MADLGHSLEILPEIHEYCSKVCENSRVSILDSIWEGLYFDFVDLFSKIHERNYKQLK